jgi:predicted KAP-like P-loop ATPase
VRNEISNELSHLSFEADAPIKECIEDLLNRSSFASSLAEAINGWHASESLVIGLSGAWGSGKTSIKNLVLEAFEKTKKKPHILQFNPWQWAGQELLSKAFLSEIAIAIGRADKSKSGRKLASHMKLYGEMLFTAAHASSGIGKVLPMLLTAASFLGVMAFLPLLGTASKIVIVIAWLLIISSALEWGGALFQKLASVFAAQADCTDVTLEDQKTALRLSLAKQDRPLLVIVDDIDRLTAPEVRLLLQLVKANLDFPNLVFLLLYDRSVVEKFLDAEGFPGFEYLRKIVQVPFDVPNANKHRIDSVLFSRLDIILETINSRVRFDATRWGNLFYGPLSPYFDSLRSIYRFLATLQFHVGLFRGASAFEVNAIDLIAVETLRVFEPEVYVRLRSSSTAFTGIISVDGYSSEAHKLAAKEQVEFVIAAAPPETRTRVKELLTLLFPKLESIYGNHYYSYESEQRWLHEARVCSKEKFNRYFQLALGDDELSESDITDLLEATSNYDAFLATVAAFQNRGLIEQTLDALDQYKQKIDLKCASEFLPALIDLADDLPNTNSTMLSALRHATRVIYWYLKQSNDPKHRYELLEAAFVRAKGLAAIAFEISYDEESEKKGDESALLLAPSDRIHLRDLWLDRIREHSADPERILALSSAGQILFFWKNWADSSEVQRWAERSITSPKLALLLVWSLTSRATSSTVGDRVSKVSWRVQLEALEKFIAIETVEELLSQVSTESISEMERIALNAFQVATKRRRAGKPTDALIDDL